MLVEFFCLPIGTDAAESVHDRVMYRERLRVLLLSAEYDRCHQQQDGDWQSGIRQLPVRQDCPK